MVISVAVFSFNHGLFAWVYACECYFLTKGRRKTVASLNLVCFRLGVADDIDGACSFFSFI